MEGTVANADQRASFSAATSSLYNSAPHNRGEIKPDRLAVIMRDVWGEEATAAVHQYTGKPDRSCRGWCAKVKPVDAPSSVLIAILRGKEGYRILRRIMEPDSPEWWLTIQRERQLAALVDDLLKCVKAKALD